MPYLSSIQLRNLRGAAIVILLHVWFKGDFLLGLSFSLLLCACQQMAEWWEAKIKCPLLETLLMWLEQHLDFHTKKSWADL